MIIPSLNATVPAQLVGTLAPGDQPYMSGLANSCGQLVVMLLHIEGELDRDTVGCDLVHTEIVGLAARAHVLAHNIYIIGVAHMSSMQQRRCPGHAYARVRTSPRPHVSAI
jgi:hypothetical protein